MRKLKFIVKGQLIEQDPSCDFSGLVPGTEGYLQAEFSFSKDWDNVTKVVSFRSAMGMEYEPQVLDESNSCVIPVEALKKRVFKIRIIGKSLDIPKMQTNTVAVSQNGG